jgi:hypothetical protein
MRRPIRIKNGGVKIRGARGHQEDKRRKGAISRLHTRHLRLKKISGETPGNRR